MKNLRYFFKKRKLKKTGVNLDLIYEIVKKQGYDNYLKLYKKPNNINDFSEYINCLTIDVIKNKEYGNIEYRERLIEELLFYEFAIKNPSFAKTIYNTSKKINGKYNHINGLRKVISSGVLANNPNAIAKILEGDNSYIKKRIEKNFNFNDNY